MEHVLLDITWFIRQYNWLYNIFFINDKDWSIRFCPHSILLNTFRRGKSCLLSSVAIENVRKPQVIALVIYLTKIYIHKVKKKMSRGKGETVCYRYPGPNIPISSSRPSCVETRRQWPNYVAEFYTSFLPNALVRKQSPRTCRLSLFAARGVLETIVSRTTLNDLPTQQLLSTFSRPSRQAAQRRKILRL